MRVSRPVFLTPRPRISPPKTNQVAPEWNPENTTLAGAIANTTAINKKINEEILQLIRVQFELGNGFVGVRKEK